METSATRRYAVLFKVFFWDDFVARRLAALIERRTDGEVWVVVDDTHGFVSGITHDRIFRTRVPDLLRLGLPDEPRGKLHWYNVDYQLLAFSRAHPDHPYYVMVEHDAAVLRDLDTMVETVATRGIDCVAHPLADPVRDWPWTATLLELWPEDRVLNQLLVIAVFSRRAVAYLWRQRLMHAGRFARGELRQWPFCEGYVPTVLREGGFSLAPLSAFGATDQMEWWPPRHESELAAITGDAFAHPVLTGERYVTSMLRFPPPETWFQPGSPLRAKLDQETPEVVVTALVETFMRQENIAALIALRQTVEDHGWHDCAFTLEPLINPANVSGEARLLTGLPGARQSVSHAPRAGEAGKEPCSWWMVDLGEICWIQEIRPRGPESAIPFSLWRSNNGRGWELVMRHNRRTDEQALVLAFQEGLLARFIRIEWEGPEDPTIHALDIGGIALAGA